MCQYIFLYKFFFGQIQNNDLFAMRLVRIFRKLPKDVSWQLLIKLGECTETETWLDSKSIPVHFDDKMTTERLFGYFELVKHNFGF